MVGVRVGKGGMNGVIRHNCDVRVANMKLTFNSFLGRFFFSLFAMLSISVPLLCRYPVEAVEIMHRICREAEAAVYHRQQFEALRLAARSPLSTTDTMAIASVDAAFAHGASAIIVLTTTGR